MPGIRGLKQALVGANWVFVIVVVILLAMIPFFLLFSAGNNPFAGSGGGGPRNAFSTWIYKNFSDLKANSPVVAVLTITALNATYCDSPHVGCVARDYDFQASVSSYVKGAGNRTMYVSDAEDPGNPLPLVGNEYVLFLSNDWTCLPSPPAAPCVLPRTPLSMTFHIVGGPQGKFLIQNGMVYGFRSLYPQDDDWIKVDANGVPLNQFVGTVQTS